MSDAIERGEDAVLRLRELGTDGPPEPSVVDSQQRRTVLRGGCRTGELTVLGAQQARTLGGRVRELYGVPERLTARTTNVARCVLSLRFVVEGLLGGLPAQPVDADTVHASREWLTPPARQCPRLQWLWQELSAAWAPEGLASLRAKLDRADAAHDFQFPKRAVPLKDVLVARHSLGAGLPWGVDDAELEALDAAAAREVAVLVGVGVDDPDAGRELRQLCAGRLVHELKTHLLEAEPNSIRLVSGHDTTVLPLLVALDAYDYKWPPFCACVAVELYHHAQDHERRAVRVLYNGLTAPHVADAAQDFYVLRDLAPLEDFIALLGETCLSPNAFAQACAAPRESSTIEAERVAANTGGSSF